MRGKGNCISDVNELLMKSGTGELQMLSSMKKFHEAGEDSGGILSH